MAASVQVPGVESEKAPFLMVKLSSPFRTAILALLVAVVSYLACWLGGTIILHNQGISVLWPACAVLVSVMLLVPSRTWPVFIPAGLAGFVVHDLRSGFALWQVALLNLGDTIEVLIVGLGLRRFFNGIARLNSLKALAKYCFFAVFLGPFVSSFVGAAATPGSYMVNWRLWFLSDALAFLTLTPAILSWASERRVWTYRSLHSKLEAAALVGALTLLGYLTFLAPWRTTPSMLIYSLVPFLLWAAVRFGSMGVSTSMIVISFLSIWGAIYGHGPFSGLEPYRTVLSLQLFLMFAAIPFMVLAALAEERGRDQEVLRESEERLRLAQSAARIGTFEWNIRTGVNTWTPELEAMYGLPPGGFGGTQTAFENLVHPDDRARVIELDNWALKTGEPTRGEWRVVWPDGSVRWIAGRWKVYMNESGHPARMVGVNMDITDHKLAEQELSKANERLRLALEAGSAGGWDYDLKTGKDVWFGTAHAQLGMTPDETVGSRKEFWDRIHEDDRKRVEHALQVAKEKREEFAEDVRIVWRDGTTHWLRSRGRFQYAANGEAERSLGISLDITERKMAEDRLRDYQEAVEGAEDIIGVIDRQYRFVLANRQYLEMRNLTREQVVGHLVTDVLNEELFKTVIKPKLDECFQGKVVRYEMKFSYPTVGERELLLSYFPIEGVNGIDRVVCILRDITDRKQMEEALSDMTKKLVEAQEQERVRIARELHDDIAQRLAILAIEIERATDDRTEITEVRDRVRELSMKTNGITSDIQSLTHELHSSALEYLGLEAGMRSWCKEFSERQKLQITFQSHDVLQLPNEISLCLFRVLQEALQNAAKHSGTERIEVQLAGNSGEIHLIVSDAGEGFDTTAPGRRRGLGLTSMQERVRLVGGTIEIASKPEVGTTIHVCVPLRAERDYKATSCGQ